MTVMTVFRRFHLSVGEEKGKEMPTHPCHPNILQKDVEIIIFCLFTLTNVVLNNR